MLTVLIMILPVVVCFLYGMYLDERPAGTRRGQTGSVTEADSPPAGEGSVLDRASGESEQPFRPPAEGWKAEVRAKRIRLADQEPAPVDSYNHPTAVPLSMEWTALDQLQLERVLRAEHQRSR
jgi:hypothetical protein